MRRTGTAALGQLRDALLTPAFVLAAHDCIGAMATRAADGLLTHPDLMPPFDIDFGTPSSGFEIGDVVRPLRPEPGKSQLDGYVTGVRAGHVALLGRKLYGENLSLGARVLASAHHTVENYGVTIEIATPHGTVYGLRMNRRGFVPDPFVQESDTLAGVVADRLATAALIGHGVEVLTGIDVGLSYPAALLEELQARYPAVRQPAQGQPFWTISQSFQEYVEPAA